MSESPITAEYFRKPLARLCQSGGATTLLRARQDRQILVKSMLILLDPAEVIRQAQGEGAARKARYTRPAKSS